MKQCPNCGAWNTDDAHFCKDCGTQLPDAAPQPGYQNQAPGGMNQAPGGMNQAPGGMNQAPGQQGYGNPGGPFLIQPRSVALCIVLTIITCGIYGLYWMYCLNEETNQLVGNQGYTNGALVIVFDIITCGIYGIYWAYKMGENITRIKGDSSYSIVFLVLSLFGLQFINFALIQDTLNKCA